MSTYRVKAFPSCTGGLYYNVQRRVLWIFWANVCEFVYVESDAIAMAQRLSEGPGGGVVWEDS